MHLYDMYSGSNYESLKTSPDVGQLHKVIDNCLFIIHTYNGELIDAIDVYKTDNPYEDNWYPIMTTRASSALDDKGGRIPGSIYKKKYSSDYNPCSTVEIMDYNTDCIAYPLGLVVYMTNDADIGDYELLSRCLYELATNPAGRYWLPATHYIITSHYPYRYFE